MKDVEAQFNKIVEGIDMDDRSDPRHVTLWEINRAIAGMNNICTSLGLIMAEVFKENAVAFPTELTPFLREIIQITDQMAKLLTECSCPDCEISDEDLCPQCLDHPEGMCDDCAIYFARELDDEDDG